jgi:c-di-GMP-binding flagellar brake protein YcgR
MQEQGQSYESTDRRKYKRLSVFSFMHATATLSDSVSTGQKGLGEHGQYWTGLLEDVSYNGAQIILPKGCEKHLKEQQDVAMRIKTTFIEDVKIDVTARLKYIVPAQTHNGMQVGVQFTGLDKNPQARDAILRICEYGQKLKAVGASTED